MLEYILDSFLDFDSNSVYAHSSSVDMEPNSSVLICWEFISVMSHLGSCPRFSSTIIYSDFCDLFSFSSSFWFECSHPCVK